MLLAICLISIFSDQSDNANRKQHTQPREDVAVLGIEGDIVAEAIFGGKRVDLVARNALAHAAIRIDDGSDAVVGIAQQPAAVFDGAHAGYVEVLPGGAGVAVPSVVADVDENFGAELGEVANLIGKDSFVADEDAVAMAVEAEDFALVPASKFRNAAGELVGEVR